MTSEPASCHEQASIHPTVVAIETQRMADQLREIRRLLRRTQFRGLAQLVHHAQLELELISLNAKEAAEYERNEGNG